MLRVSMQLLVLLTPPFSVDHLDRQVSLASRSALNISGYDSIQEPTLIMFLNQDAHIRIQNTNRAEEASDDEVVRGQGFPSQRNSTL
jgi:hypothetical protein